MIILERAMVIIPLNKIKGWPCWSQSNIYTM